MDFNPFAGFAQRKSHLQNMAEDASFQDVTQSADDHAKIDKVARFQQISDRALAHASKAMNQDPIKGLFILAVFTKGALWADEHPLTAFDSPLMWARAQRVAVDCILEEAKTSKDPIFDTVVFAIFHMGAKWASENLAPTM